MIELLPAVAVIGYFLCSVMSYFLFRAQWRAQFDNDWRVSNRNAVIFLSLFGPISLTVAIATALTDNSSNDPPASW